MLSVTANISAKRENGGHIVTVNNSMFSVPHGGNLRIGFRMHGSAMLPVITPIAEGERPDLFTAFVIEADGIEGLAEKGVVAHYVSVRRETITGRS